VITEMATLPLRLGVRLASRLFEAAETGVNLARYVAEALGPSAPRPPGEYAAERARRPAPAPVRPAREPEPGPEPEPVHVSEEPVVVAEVGSAEVGAQVSVAEPWEGYRRMKAADVIDRLAAATPAELAVVQLFEGQGRARKTVLAAVERRLAEETYSQRK
jgi:hypothetical protein